ncbi:Craniofacial development protein 1, partial [Stegodyphus mimosarum]
MTTLQKSLLDWKTFKKEEGLEEDLEQYNRGRGGYLEKQKFLQRSDLRRFELEKNARLSKYRKT